MPNRFRICADDILLRVLRKPSKGSLRVNKGLQRGLKDVRDLGLGVGCWVLASLLLLEVTIESGKQRSRETVIYIMDQFL